MDDNELKKLDHTYLWHPFTQMQEWMEEDPCIIERGEGNLLVDRQGRKYIDGVSSLWCNLHGHRRQELDDALKEQIDGMILIVVEICITMAEKLFHF